MEDEIELILEQYKKHPRVLEVKFVLLFDMFEREFGLTQTTAFFEMICKYFKCNYTFIKGIINQRFDIKRLAKRKPTRWRQEAIFVGACYGVSVYKICNNVILYGASNAYQNKLQLKNFITHEWLLGLDEEIKLAGVPSYRLELDRFLEALDSIGNVLIKWGG